MAGYSGFCRRLGASGRHFKRKRDTLRGFFAAGAEGPGNSAT
jgi:hypothetical protein